MNSLLAALVFASVAGLALIALILTNARRKGLSAVAMIGVAMIMATALFGSLAAYTLALRWGNVDLYSLFARAGFAVVGPLCCYFAGRIATGRFARSPGRSPAPKAVRAAAGPRVRASGATPDVFISYKRDERPQVLAIARRLEALKLNVWFDAEMRSGTTFDAEIDRQVRAAKCVLVCWSPGAVASDWVRGEATIGRQRGVLAACLLKECDLPAPFNLVHADDLRAGPGPHNPEWLKVLERIGALVGRPGLGAYEALDGSSDAVRIAAWVAQNGADPLFDDAMARMRK